jgi:hypothetical protein
MRTFALVFALFLSCTTLAQDAKKPEPPKPPPKDEAKVEIKPGAGQLISIEKSSKPDPCVIRPVMSDKELRDCGAQLPGR